MGILYTRSAAQLEQKDLTLSTDTPSAREPAGSEIQDYQRQLRRLSSELSLAEARERREIASDLHDHVGQALALVAQKVSMMQGNAIFSGMDTEFSAILSLLDQTIRYTRDLTVEISPPVLYDLGLAAAIEWQARRAHDMYDLKVKFSGHGAPQEVSEHVKVFAFKAVQELIRNVVRHARATRAEVSLNWRDRDFEIVVEDDGQGFVVPDAGEGAAPDSCFGLFSIRERLSYIGGTLDIASTAGRGTRVSIAAPYGTTGGQG